MKGPPDGPRSWFGPILRVPLFYKILWANVAIVVLGAIVGTWLTASVARGNPGLSPLELVLVFAGIGAVVSAFVNGVILQLALSPLRNLEDAAARIGAGEERIRVSPSVLADRNLRRLTSTFNEMLDTLARYRSRLRALAIRTMDSAERERNRIARELHDDTAQHLVALQLRVRMLGTADDPKERDEGLDEVADELREAVHGVQRLARGLRPPALDELGLVSAIRSYARTQSETFRVPVDVEGGADPTLPPHLALALYRIVQEAVSNALRHGDPSRVRIVFAEDPGELRVTVEDDGSGFDTDEVLSSERKGLGLAGMQERVGFVGGQLTIESEPGQGTRVDVRVPRTPRQAAG